MNSLARSTLLVALVAASRAHAQDADAPPPASTEAVEGCVAAHEKARLSLLGEDFTAAQQAVAACAVDACPLAIRSDCSAWQGDLEKLLPTLLIVVERRTSKNQLTLVLDGRTIELSEPSAPIETLPGSHRLVLRLPPFAPIEQTVTLEKGEKNHLVRVRFGSDEPAAPPPPPVIRTTRPLPWSTIALSSGALVGFATSTAFLVSALSKRAEARAQCSPVCDKDVRSTIESRLLLADLSGGAGLVLAGLAAYSYWKRPIVRERVGLSLPSVAVSPSGAQLSLEGDF